MAIIKMGVIVTGIRGTVGGLTFTNTIGGPTCKKWACPVRRNTQKQSGVKGLLSGWPAKWRALEEYQREAWETWGKLPAQVKQNSLGEDYYLSGFNWFVAVNTWRSAMGLYMAEEPPVDAWPDIPDITGVTFSVAGDVVTLDIEWPAYEFLAGQAATVYAVLTSGAGRMLKQSGYRHVQTVVDPGTTHRDFGTELKAIFGVPYSGDKVFIRVSKNTINGLRGSAYQISVVCT